MSKANQNDHLEYMIEYLRLFEDNWKKGKHRVLTLRAMQASLFGLSHQKSFRLPFHTSEVVVLSRCSCEHPFRTHLASIAIMEAFIAKKIKSTNDLLRYCKTHSYWIPSSRSENSKMGQFSKDNPDFNLSWLDAYQEAGIVLCKIKKGKRDRATGIPVPYPVVKRYLRRYGFAF